MSSLATDQQCLAPEVMRGNHSSRENRRYKQEINEEQIDNHLLFPEDEAADVSLTSRTSSTLALVVPRSTLKS